MTGVARWNYQRLLDLKQPDVVLPPVFDPLLITELNSASKRVTGKEKYPVLHLSVRDTGEKFGLEYREPECHPVQLDWNKHRVQRKRRQRDRRQSRDPVRDSVRRQSREHTPITIDKTPVERVNSFKFLGVHITEDLTWSTHTDAVLKKAHQRLFFLRRLRKFGMSPSILRSFYTCTVESILTGCITAWFGNSTAGNRKALQRVVRTARHIVGGELPSLQDIYTRRCIRKARRIIKDSSHPSHRLLSLLPSGRRLRSIRSRTSRLRDSFFPQAIRQMNSQN